MTYTAFKKGDKVKWSGTSAKVVEDSSEVESTVFVEIDGQYEEQWCKTYMSIPVVLDENA